MCQLLHILNFLRGALQPPITCLCLGSLCAIRVTVLRSGHCRCVVRRLRYYFESREWILCPNFDEVWPSQSVLMRIIRTPLRSRIRRLRPGGN